MPAASDSVKLLVALDYPCKLAALLQIQRRFNGAVLPISCSLRGLAWELNPGLSQESIRAWASQARERKGLGRGICRKENTGLPSLKWGQSFSSPKESELFTNLEDPFHLNFHIQKT